MRSVSSDDSLMRDAMEQSSRRRLAAVEEQRLTLTLTLTLALTLTRLAAVEEQRRRQQQQHEDGAASSRPTVG